MQQCRVGSWGIKHMGQLFWCVEVTADPYNSSSNHTQNVAVDVETPIAEVIHVG